MNLNPDPLYFVLTSNRTIKGRSAKDMAMMSDDPWLRALEERLALIRQVADCKVIQKLAICHPVREAAALASLEVFLDRQSGVSSVQRQACLAFHHAQVKLSKEIQLGILSAAKNSPAHSVGLKELRKRLDDVDRTIAAGILQIQGPSDLESYIQRLSSISKPGLIMDEQLEWLISQMRVACSGLIV